MDLLDEFHEYMQRLHPGWTMTVQPFGCTPAVYGCEITIPSYEFRADGTTVREAVGLAFDKLRTFDRRWGAA